jgi:hypothetical protein
VVRVPVGLMLIVVDGCGGFGGGCEKLGGD